MSDGRRTPFTLWLATAKPGETFIREGTHDVKMALAARRAGRTIATTKAVAVTAGLDTLPITIATMKDEP